MSTLVGPCWGVSLKVRRVQSEEEQRYQISRTVGSTVWGRENPASQDGRFLFLCAIPAQIGRSVVLENVEKYPVSG